MSDKHPVLFAIDLGLGVAATTAMIDAAGVPCVIFGPPDPALAGEPLHTIVEGGAPPAPALLAQSAVLRLHGEQGIAALERTLEMARQIALKASQTLPASDGEGPKGPTEHNSLPPQNPIPKKGNT